VERDDARRVALSMDMRESDRGPTKRGAAKAVKRVAGFLGNTPAVARASYIDPRVIDRYLSAGPSRRAGGGRRRLRLRTREDSQVIEEAVIDLIEERKSPALEKAA
jgi:DNA topoisomerase IB